MTITRILSNPQTQKLLPIICVSLFIVVACSVTAYLVVRAVERYQDRKRREYVREQSSAIARLLEVNAVYQNRFHRNVPEKRDYYESLNSKSQFDRFDSVKYAAGIVREEYKTFETEVRLVRANRETYREYAHRCSGILSTRHAPQNLPRLFKKAGSWEYFENEVFQKCMLHPVLESKIIVHWSYTSPKGRNHYSDSCEYVTAHIARFLMSAQQRAEYEQSAKYQRSLLTPALRYKVLRRDGYRCQICGRSAKDGVELEVDHIVPVSRGGKTEMSNLQTLCRECNRGKGAKSM